MKQLLLSIVAMLGAATMAVADPTVDENGYLDIKELNAGQEGTYASYSYDSTTGYGTIVYNTNTWACPGWGWWGGTYFDPAGYNAVKVTCVSSNGWQVMVQAGAGTSPAGVSGSGSGEEETVEVVFTEDCFTEGIMQIYIQNFVQNQTVVVHSVQFVDDATPIQSIKSDSDAVEVARYNVAGQKIECEQTINIIVYSDGSSKKVLVK